MHSAKWKRQRKKQDAIYPAVDLLAVFSVHTSTGAGLLAACGKEDSYRKSRKITVTVCSSPSSQQASALARRPLLNRAASNISSDLFVRRGPRPAAPPLRHRIRGGWDAWKRNRVVTRFALARH